MISLGFLNFTTYLFMLVTLICAIGTVTNNNPVHSVLFLIGSFFGGAILMLINNSEFLAFVILTVYVGAVMVLFLFVVMMTDTEHLVVIKNSFKSKIKVALVGIGMFWVLDLVTKEDLFLHQEKIKIATTASFESQTSSANVSQARALGVEIFSASNGIMIFMVAMILFVAIVGVISLAMRKKSGLKKQNLFSQLFRSPRDAVELKKVQIGAGVDDE
jgi:NADH-quinone oxidoreductase subunit J